MDEASDKPVVCFGLFEADLRCGELRHRGAKVKLQEQPFRALALLVERAGQLVAREEFAAALWPAGIHVDFDQGIHSAIKKLRRALRDPVSRPRWIETVGRRGYRFIGKIESTKARAPGLAFVPGLTPFVGRESERQLLQQRFDAASGGQGQVVLVTGEPGIGKSRLALELATDLSKRPHSWLACRGSPQHQHTPFHPIIELLGEGSIGESELPIEKRWDGFSRALARAGVKPAEGLPLVSRILGLTVADGQPPLELSPEEARRKLLSTLTAWLVGLARLDPVVVVFEDLHWMDPSTLEFLGMLSETCASAPLLLILTTRPELRVSWPLLSHHTHVTLDRLGRKQVEEMVRSLAPKAVVSDDVVQVVVERTEGVPLFVEELTKAALEAGTQLGALREIPASVRGSLLARLDRLGPPAREAAQVGATIGREFSWILLRTVSELVDERLDAALSGLVGAELVHQRGMPPEATYTFKHALVQDAAYESLLEGQRRDLHGRIADALAAQYPERVAAAPELLARHAEAAGKTLIAVDGYQRAAEQARERSAYEEAIRHLRQAIALLATQPEGRERDAREAALQLTLGHSVISGRGYLRAEAEAAYERARELYEARGDARGLGHALYSLAVFSMASAQLEHASTLLARVLAIAEEISDTDLALGGHSQLGAVEHYQGKFASSLAHCQAALTLHDERRHQVVIDRKVMALIYSAWDLWPLGCPDRALACTREAVGSARELGHPYSLCAALCFETVVRQMRRDVSEQRERAAELIALARTHEFPFWLGLGKTLNAAARVAAGEPEAETRLLRGGFQGGGASMGAAAGVPGVLAVVGEACLAAGRLSEARGAVDRGLAVSAQTHQPYSDADLHRLRGEIVLANGGVPTDAEKHFQQALEIARSQRARSYELRAATHLARLWRDHGKPAEARALLQPVYDWFTEGFGTGDLKDARALLDELGS